MSNKLLFGGIVLLTAGFMASYLTGNNKPKLSQTKNASLQEKINYMAIHDDNSILNDYTSPHSEKEKPASPELTKYLVDKYYLQSNKQSAIPSCIKTGMCHINDEVNADAVDLNEDGVKEYLVMPWKICSCFLRGASGNGDIFVIENKGGKFWVIGQLEGNGYTISKYKTNGYFDVLTNFHNSAITGTETLYKFQVFSNGDTITPNYEPMFTKWYDLSRTK